MVTFQIAKTDFHVWIRKEFPSLLSDHYRLTSPIADDYNCIAWAADDTQRWWWPSEDGFWPDGLPLLDTLDNFIEAFALEGYVPCDNGDLEAGYEKVVMYQGADGAIKHMARQLQNGTWSSKLGKVWDIEHKTPMDLVCRTYGIPVQYLKRPVQP
jgi:hypothetical protein